jgi:hypothetical protein
MPLHSDRRMTLQSAKRGPPLRGCYWKPLGQRYVACPGNQPGLRAVPCREASSSNHGATNYGDRAPKKGVPGDAH